MRRLFPLLVLAFACKQSQPPPEPQPRIAPVVITDAAVAIAPDAGPPSPKLRVEGSGFGVDPARASTSKTFMVASEDEHATKVGRDVLAAGGNAVDAAVATAFTLAVTRPTAGNIAGGGFAVVRTGKGKAMALDFRETAPAAATSDMFDKEPPKASLMSLKGVGVPGSVAGLWELHKKHGTKKWKDLIAPAIAAARDGYTA